MRGGYLELPEGWERISTGGPGPFVTSELLRRPDGTEVRWRSRAHRKGGRSPSPVSAGAKTNSGDSELVWWRPRRRGWWMSVLFSLGSLCFTVAAIAAQWASISRPGIGVTFFFGSLLFTSAAYLQYSETVNVERSLWISCAALAPAAGLVGTAADRLARRVGAVDRDRLLQPQHVRGDETRL